MISTALSRCCYYTDTLFISLKPRPPPPTPPFLYWWVWQEKQEQCSSLNSQQSEYRLLECVQIQSEMTVSEGSIASSPLSCYLVQGGRVQTERDSTGHLNRKHDWEVWGGFQDRDSAASLSSFQSQRYHLPFDSHITQYIILRSQHDHIFRDTTCRHDSLIVFLLKEGFSLRDSVFGLL